MNVSSPLAGLWLSSFLTDYLSSTKTPTVAGFLSVMLANASQWIAAMKSRGITQGIAWDLSLEDAQQHSKPRSPYNAVRYVGDVGATDPLFPASSIAALAKAFTAAGIDLGCCCRTGVIEKDETGAYRRTEPDDFGYNLQDKIARAKALGLNGIIYCDSNILNITRAALPAELFYCLRTVFPTTLVAFEHTEGSVVGNPPSNPADYWSPVSCGYFTPTDGNPPPAINPNGWPAGPYLIHPSDYNASTGPWLETQFDAFVAAVKGGARMILRGRWPADPYSDFVRRVIASASAA